MNWGQILSYLGVLGLGGILGIIIKSIVDFKISKRKLLFEARTKAYAGITGRIFNLFLEPDITVLKDEALIFAKINALLSEVFLLGSKKLVDLIGDYKVKINEFHKKLTDKEEGNEIDKLHKQLVDLTGKIFDQMRKDSFITSKSVWEKPKKKKNKTLPLNAADFFRR